LSREGTSDFKTVGCQFCGSPYEAYPPNEMQTVAWGPDPCFYCLWSGTIREMQTSIECQNCHRMNKMYWHVNMPHPHEEILEANTNYQRGKGKREH
jgi:hypothetical protein